MSIITKIFGDPNEKVINNLRKIVAQINALEPAMQKLSDVGLRAKTLEFKARLGATEVAQDVSAHPDFRQDNKIFTADLEKKLNDLLPEAFAVMREASHRVLGQRHYNEQLIGGMVLHYGQIAEMKTGEGKTLVATLPLYLNALAGYGVHLVTVNDYLSRVGAGWMAPVFHFLGLTTAVVVHESALIYDPEYNNESQYDPRMRQLKPIQRAEAYRCDILYGTNNEFGFDYLRDNMAGHASQTVQRGLNFSIVDEVDSILIDEARTPLIISAPAEESTDKYYQFADLVKRLAEDEDYNLDEKMRAVTLTEAGIEKMEKWLGVENIYTMGGLREVHHIEQALKAQVLFKVDRDYVIKDGEVIIVDEFTGRLMHGRRYSEGLHQAIEAKENVKIQRESETLATVTFQNYFRMYRKLAGMTGTAVTEAEEFSKIYNLETVMIPTHRPMVRKDMNDLIYRSEMGKFKAVVEETKLRHQAGQPVLIGTISIEKNEVLSDIMEREGLQPQVLNAKNHDREAQIISQAGKFGAITIATNMAGRGVDIMLGGVEPEKDSSEYETWQQDRQKVLAAGGLHVIGTERHESRRIDNQLRGRAGRQGDAGSSQFYISTEDDLMRIFGGERMKKIMATLRVPEDMPIENGMISKSIESAQRKVEGNNFDIRKHLVEYDDVLNKHREAIYRRRREIIELSGANDNIILEAETKEREDKLAGIVLDMIEKEIEQVVIFHTSAKEGQSWDVKEIKEVISTIFPVDAETDQFFADFNAINKDAFQARNEIVEYLLVQAKKHYTGLKEKAAVAGINWAAVEKEILIRTMDTLWIEHLEAINAMRQGIGLRGYGQRDPLVEYKKEAYRLFNELQSYIQKEVVYSIFKVMAVSQAPLQNFNEPNLLDRAQNFSAPAKEMGGTTGGLLTMNLAKEKVKDESGEKVGRNDLCPCGSGKKYKKCCGK